MEKFAFFSVTDKREIRGLAQKVSQSHTIIASEGTGIALKDMAIPFVSVHQFTNSPEMFGGRVKTLHPKIHGAILRRNNQSDREEAKIYGIEEIDLVVCNLYNFQERVEEKAELQQVIDSIDIGGPTLIRSAAKNFERVTVLTDPEDYSQVIAQLPAISRELRLKLAAKAFHYVSQYDLHISSFFAGLINTQSLSITGYKYKELRYGENSHQKADHYSFNGEVFYETLSDNSPSYNNIMDITAGWGLVNEFSNPTCVIVKHRTPCGVASMSTTKDAYVAALETDKMSAYGGVYLFNRELDADTARELVKTFVDVLAAPAFTKESLEILKTKSKMKILVMKDIADHKIDLSLVPGGFLVQDRDNSTLEIDQLNQVSKVRASDETLQDLIFAWKVVKHSKSNAVVITKGTKALGIGSGMVSRVDATDIAIKKAGSDIQNSVMASDAFFPFADLVELASEVGIKAIITPHGSIRDPEIIEAADKAGIILVFTPFRAFRH